MNTSDKDIDHLIREALATEDRAILDEFGPEQSWLSQAFASFTGRHGWVVWVMYLTNLVAAGGMIWGIWALLQTTDLLVSLRWGVWVLGCMNIGLFMKHGINQQMQANRVLREIKRVELQIARLRSSDRA